MKTARLNVGGMSCGHCVAAVENAVPVDITADGAPEQLVAAVQQTGYQAEIAGRDAAGAP